MTVSGRAARPRCAAAVVPAIMRVVATAASASTRRITVTLTFCTDDYSILPHSFRCRELKDAAFRSRGVSMAEVADR
jgi:hypothetical protein